MRVLEFQFGRLVFSSKSLKMEPSLPDKVPARAQYFHFEEGIGFVETGFFDFKALKKDLEKKKFVWLHLSGSVSDDFLKHLAEFADFSDEQVKMLKFPHELSVFEEYSNGLFWSMQRPYVTENIEAIENVNFFLIDRVLISRQFSQDAAFNLVSHRLMSKGPQLTEFSVDKLAGYLIDDVLQSYVGFLSAGGVKLESIQNKIIRRPGSEELQMINAAQQMIWIFLKCVRLQGPDTFADDLDLPQMCLAPGDAFAGDGKVQKLFDIRGWPGRIQILSGGSQFGHPSL